MSADNRGSEEQRIIYRFLKELYPNYDVIYEATLPNGMRFDCFVKQIGVVVEIDGKQHTQFVEHFHGDFNGFLSQQLKDSKKDTIAAGMGIRLLRINQWDCPKTKEELKDMIDSIPDPGIEYDYLVLDNDKPNKANEKIKEIKRKRYLEYKNSRRKE